MTPGPRESRAGHGPSPDQRGGPWLDPEGLHVSTVTPQAAAGETDPGVGSDQHKEANNVMPGTVQVKLLYGKIAVPRAAIVGAS